MDVVIDGDGGGRLAFRGSAQVRITLASQFRFPFEPPLLPRSDEPIGVIVNDWDRASFNDPMGGGCVYMGQYWNRLVAGETVRVSVPLDDKQAVPGTVQLALSWGGSWHSAEGEGSTGGVGGGSLASSAPKVLPNVKNVESTPSALHRPATKTRSRHNPLPTWSPRRDRRVTAEDSAKEGEGEQSWLVQRRQPTAGGVSVAYP